MEDVVIKTSGLTKDYGKGRGVFEIDLEAIKARFSALWEPMVPGRQRQSAI